MPTGSSKLRSDSTSEFDSDVSSPRVFYGWVIVGVSFLATFAQVGFFNTVIGIFLPALHDEFGWSRAEIAGAVALGSILGGLLAPLFGIVVDRYGARWVMAGPAIAMAITCLLLAEQRDLLHFYLLFAFGRGLGIAAIQASAVVAVSNWFIRRRPFAIALGTLGIRVGNAVLPLVVAFVISTRGWPDGFRVLAVVLLILVVLPPLLFLRRRPEDLGLRPDGDPPVHDEVDDLSGTLDPDWTLLKALRTRAYWLVGGAFSLAIFGNGALNFHLVPHLVDQGLSIKDAALAITVLSICGACGSLLGGVIATRIRPRWTMVGALLFQCTGVLLLFTIDDLTLALVYAIWYGFFLGAMVTQLQVVYADYFGRLQLGLIRGSFLPIALAFNAIGPLFVGIWFDRAGDYNGAFICIIVLFILAAVGLALARYPTLPQNAVANFRVGE
jgi:OFA family oxalate/formate antiporter-like MFS transporter